MINFPQTSLIPSVIALSQFYSDNFPNLSWYPYWYLGTPFHYLIGPVVPTVLVIISKVLPLNITQSYLLAIFLSQLFTTVGLMIFLKSFGVKKALYLLSGLLYLALPGGWLLLNFQNGLNHIAMAFLPVILLFYQKYLTNFSVKTTILISIMIAITLLTNIYSLLPTVIGLISLQVSLTPKKNWAKGGLNISLIILLSLSLASFWYTPKFYLVLLSNPSFGGVPLINLIVSLFKYLLNFLPLILAILVVKLARFKPSQAYLQFAILFFSSFLTLTGVRFLSDPDFVIDWVGFLLELQFAGAILLSGLLIRGSTPKSKYISVAVISIIIISLYTSFNIIKSSPDVQKYQQSVTALLKNNTNPQERIFMSGSSVFWINTHSNIQQVRGGYDSAAIHPFSNHASFQIREGQNSQLASDWLKILGVSKILVNDPISAEYFHDFKYPDKFLDTQSFSLITKDSGNYLFSVNNSSHGRIASENIQAARPPQNGADSAALTNYLAAFQDQLPINLSKPNKIDLRASPNQDQVISLSLSYDPNWKIIEGQGRLAGDSFGNTLIIPSQPGTQAFTIEYQPSTWNSVFSFSLTMLSLFLILNSNRLFNLVSRLFRRFSVGISEEE